MYFSNPMIALRGFSRPSRSTGVEGCSFGGGGEGSFLSWADEYAAETAKSQTAKSTSKRWIRLRRNRRRLPSGAKRKVTLSVEISYQWVNLCPVYLSLRARASAGSGAQHANSIKRQPCPTACAFSRRRPPYPFREAGPRRGARRAESVWRPDQSIPFDG